MCGIAGILALGGGEIDADLIGRMSRALAHRGPDGESTVADGPVHLGHRRLAVIDLSRDADQPMQSDDGDQWIVFNGEIYNHDEQRRRLVSLGHHFRSRSDTEVILNLYRQHGDACVDFLRGMFAFAIWDRPRQRLFLARDRLGKKPLYYCATPDRFSFASEIKALRCDPQVPTDIDPIALSDFLAFDYVPGPGTVFRAIRQLPPAHIMVVERGRIDTKRYWQLPSVASQPAPPVSTAMAEIVERLSTAIRIRLMSDVPLGVFLSGGIDSSAIVALMRRLTDAPIQTFAVGFAEPNRDERPYAHAVAQRFGTDHHEFAYSPRFDEHLDEVIAHFDQPYADPAMLPTWELARQARQHITVALTGEGGDECFAGYDRYVKNALAAYWAKVPRLARRGAAAIFDRLFAAAPADRIGKRLQEFFALGLQPPEDLFAHWLLHCDRTLEDELFSADFRAATRGHDATERIRVLYRQSSRRDDVNKLLDIDTQTYLPDDLLVKVDMATMRHSLEARCPFLDQEVVEYVARLPGDWKLRRLTTKWILRRALGSILPKDILVRPKAGFGPPVHLWLRDGLRQHATEVLTDRRTEQRGYFRPATVRRLLEEHTSGRRNHGYQLWNLLVLELWHRSAIDRS